MANYQSGYGHGDVVGVPFDFYAGATLVTGSTITMQTAVLVLTPPGAISLTINLPLNPVDGAVAEVCNASAFVITVTALNANTGDTVQGAALASLAAITAAAQAASCARYKYTLNGFQPASGAAVNPRTWLRVQ